MLIAGKARDTILGLIGDKKLKARHKKKNQRTFKQGERSYGHRQLNTSNKVYRRKTP